MSLNGWQRFWIYASLILAVPISLVTWVRLPSDEQIKAAWANAAISAVQYHDDLKPWLSPSQVRAALFAGLDNDAIIERARKYAQESYERNAKANARHVPLMLLEIRLADEWYGRQLAAREAARHRHMAIGATVWLCLVVLMYGLGRIGSWIQRPSASNR